jgi:hypothetical protein
MEAGQERLLEVGVAVAFVVAELLVVADVLAEEDPVRVAAGQELEQQVDDARLAVALLGREGHAEEVEFDARAPSNDLEVVVEDG